MKQIFSLILLVGIYFQVNAQEDTRKIINLGKNVNSESIEINPHISADGKTIYYVRDNHKDNQNTQDIWVSEVNEKGEWGPATILKKPLNTAEANSVSSVSNDGNELLIKGFFQKGKYKGRGYSLTRKTKDGWAEPGGLQIDHLHAMDKGQFNGACISNDDQILILTICETDKGMDNDLYVSFRKVNGSYTQPLKLKGAINAQGAFEFAPFLASDNKTLYFASDRPGGLGGTDIYKCERLDSTWLHWSNPENMGPNINSAGRDAYYCLDARGEFAYLVSDKNSLGLADIVKIPLEQKQKPKPVVLLKGNVYDAKTKKPLDAAVEYHEYPSDTMKGKKFTDHETGMYSIIFPYGAKYVISAHAHGYVASFDTISFKLDDNSTYQEVKRDFYLTPIVKGEKVVLKHVNFETNSAVLLPESFPELDKVVDFLKQNEEVEIMIGGHTDNAGSHESNQKLSDARALSVMNYILSKGINSMRITSKGFGETQPMVENNSPENMAINRRVEFTITKE